MEIKKVIKRKYLPSRSPLASSIVYLLALEYWNAPQWAWGCVCFLIILVWVNFIISFFSEEGIDIKLAKKDDNI